MQRHYEVDCTRKPPRCEIASRSTYRHRDQKRCGSWPNGDAAPAPNVLRRGPAPPIEEERRVAGEAEPTHWTTRIGSPRIGTVRTRTLELAPTLRVTVDQTRDLREADRSAGSRLSRSWLSGMAASGVVAGSE